MDLVRGHAHDLLEPEGNQKRREKRVLRGSLSRRHVEGGIVRPRTPLRVREDRWDKNLPQSTPGAEYIRQQRGCWQKHQLALRFLQDRQCHLRYHPGDPRSVLDATVTENKSNKNIYYPMCLF